MASISVFSNESGSELSVTGDFSLLFNIRRSKVFLDSYCAYRLEQNVVVFKTNGSLTDTVNRIKKAASYSGVDVVIMDNTNQHLQKYVDEEKSFFLFSEQARKIRNNECDPGKLLTFEKTIAHHMTKRRLFDLQLLSAFHMAFSQNECNFSVPGSGKTSVVFGAFSYLRSLPQNDRKHVDNLFVICPLNAFGPWETEFESCFGRKPLSLRVSGSLPLEERHQCFYSFSVFDLVLVSYASVALLIQDVSFFLAHHKTMVVLDEAHRIKNVDHGITADSILKISPLAASRIVLTGTPAPNGYEDLNNLFKFIWPEKRLIPFNIGQLKDMSREQNDSRIPQLINAISPYFLRIKKSDLHLPRTEKHVVRVNMSPSQRRIYDFIEHAYIREMQDNISSFYISDLARARLIRLMQAATNPALLKQPLNQLASLYDFTLPTLDKDTNSLRELINLIGVETPLKYEAAYSIAKSIVENGGKVVIWATFINNVLGLTDYLNSKGIASLPLYGGTPIDSLEIDDTNVITREKIVKDFNDPNNRLKIIVANPSAVSESISLHKACHNAIYLERDFNAAHFLQSKDRIHRFGLSPGTITNYFYLISKDSIDETINERLDFKEKRLINIMESMPIPLFDNATSDFGNDDIKAIIQDYAQRFTKV